MGLNSVLFYNPGFVKWQINEHLSLPACTMRHGSTLMTKFFHITDNCATDAWFTI